MTEQIRVSEQNWKALNSMKEPGESFDDVVGTLIAHARGEPASDCPEYYMGYTCGNCGFDAPDLIEPAVVVNDGDGENVPLCSECYVERVEGDQGKA